MTEAALRAENETLRERIIQLEELLGLTFEWPLVFRLTGMEGKVLGFMLKRPILSKEAALTCLYGNLHADDEPDIKIVGVYICNIRRKLKPFGIHVKTLWGQGYYLTDETKAAIADLMTIKTPGWNKIHAHAR